MLHGAPSDGSEAQTERFPLLLSKLFQAMMVNLTQTEKRGKISKQLNYPTLTEETGEHCFAVCVLPTSAVVFLLTIKLKVFVLPQTQLTAQWTSMSSVC